MTNNVLKETIEEEWRCVEENRNSRTMGTIQSKLTVAESPPYILTNGEP